MQPAASGLDGTGVKLAKGEVMIAGGVNEKSFLRRKEGDIPADEVFFHKFFVRKAMKDKGKKQADGEDDEESQGSVAVSDNEGEESAEEMDLTGDEAKANAVDKEDEEDSDAEEDDIWKVCSLASRSFFYPI